MDGGSHSTIGCEIRERINVMQHNRQVGNIASPQQTSKAEQVALLAQQLGAEQQKSEEYLDLLHRSQADFINYKRRTAQEHSEERITPQTAVFDHLSPVL